MLEVPENSLTPVPMQSWAIAPRLIQQRCTEDMPAWRLWWQWRWRGQISVGSEKWAPTEENLHLPPIAAPVMAGAETAMLSGWPAASSLAKYTKQGFRQRHQAPADEPCRNGTCKRPRKHCAVTRGSEMPNLNAK